MLIQVLSDVDPIIRDCAVGALVNFWRTIIALGYTGSDEQTVEVLLQALNHDDPWVRRSAAIALGVIKQPADVIVPALVGKLDDEAWEGRKYSIGSLGRIGPPAKDAVPALIKVLEGPNRHLRFSATWALVQIGTPEALAAVQAAIEAFDDPWLEEFR